MRQLLASSDPLVKITLHSLATPKKMLPSPTCAPTATETMTAGHSGTDRVHDKKVMRP
ncbi:MAG: hypothetical protein RLZZ282_496 [Verrucomicrobiota bacterium]